ncbi:MAG: hypothetical protein ACYTHJ_10795 [Planctomycetota bacterium]
MTIISSLQTILFGMVAAMGQVQEQDDEGAGGKAPVDQKDAQAAEPPPREFDPQTLQLAPIGELASDRAVREAAKSEALDLLKPTVEGDDALEAIRRKLNAANILLAKGLEPSCSRWILANWKSAKPSATDLDREILAEARSLIDSVEASLKQLSADDGEAATSLNRARNHLSLYLTALEALLAADGDQAPRQKRRAASGLSILLEEDDDDVSTSAALWYAALRSTEKDKEAATSVLSLPLALRRTKMTSFEFLGRLHRCRLMANPKYPAGSIALLMQMEEASEDWFPDALGVAQARRALGVAQIQLLTSWRDDLPEDASEAERQYFEGRIGRILAESRFGSEPVFRLGQAIPDITSVKGENTSPSEG